MFLSLRYQFFLLREVEFLGFLFSKFVKCSWYLALNFLAVNPTYFSFSPPWYITVAWYTTPEDWHFSSTGHWLGSQSQGGGALSASLVTLPFGNYSSHIWETTIWQLYSIFVNNLMQNMAFWKMFLNKFEKLLANICFYIFWKWGIEPNYFPFSFSSILIVSFCWGVKL